ncbi:MAG: hypothetical protein IKW63_00215 [Elusimicrobiaceae bacterium]|nr:hypothetical protein [Elusimicrobiaceae bacterium]
MKKILIFLCCLLAPALMAQTTGYVSRAVPADVYEALLVVNEQHPNSNMTSTQAKEILKGTIVLEAGFSACGACENMIKAIEEAGLLSLWQRQGTRFYQLQSIKDGTKNTPRLIDWMTGVAETTSVPLLFVIKDGKVVAARKGYNSKDKDSFISKLKSVTLQ